MNQITKFISGLTPGQRIWAIIAAVFVFAAALDRLMIAPSMSHLSSLEDDIAKEEVTIKQDLRFLGYKDRIIQESNEVAPFLTKGTVNDDDISLAFNDKLQNLITQNKIICKVSPAKSEQDADYWKYISDLDCSGNLPNLVTFMHAVNTDTDLMKVDKYNFAAKKDADDIKATMTIERIVVTEKPMPPKASDASTPQSTPPASP